MHTSMVQKNYIFEKIKVTINFVFLKFYINAKETKFLSLAELFIHNYIL